MNLKAQEQASLLQTIMHMRCLEACAMQNIFTTTNAVSGIRS